MDFFLRLHRALAESQRRFSQVCPAASSVLKLLPLLRSASFLYSLPHWRHARTRAAGWPITEAAGTKERKGSARHLTPMLFKKNLLLLISSLLNNTQDKSVFCSRWKVNFVTLFVLKIADGQIYFFSEYFIHFSSTLAFKMFQESGDWKFILGLENSNWQKKKKKSPLSLFSYFEALDNFTSSSPVDG